MSTPDFTQDECLDDLRQTQAAVWEPCWNEAAAEGAPATAEKWFYRHHPTGSVAGLRALIEHHQNETRRKVA